MDTENEYINDVKVEKAVDLAYPLFRQHGWEYFDGEPSRERLKNTIEELVSLVTDEDDDCSLASSGRFVVKQWDDPKEVDIYLNLW